MYGHLFIKKMDPGAATRAPSLWIVPISGVVPADAIRPVAAWEAGASIPLTDGGQFIREGNGLPETGRPGGDMRLCDVDRLPALLRGRGRM